MKTIMTLRSMMISVLLPVLLCCNKPGNGQADNNENMKPIGSSKDQPGLGNTPGVPLGTALQLPACVRIVDRPHYRFKPNETKLDGLSQTFYMPVSFFNNCSAATQVELPAGLVMVSDFPELQNGLLLGSVKFNLPGKDTTTVYLGVSCLNEEKSPPLSRYSADYNIADFGYHVGNVTSDTNLLRYIQLVKDKKGLRVSRFVTNNPPDPGEETALQKMYAAMQLALWKITDGEGLTGEEVKKLKQRLAQYQ